MKTLKLSIASIVADYLVTHQCFSCDVCFLVISMCIFVSVRSSWVVYLGSPCKFMNPDEDNRNGLYTHANEKNVEFPA